jgi:uncharacterized protein (TIGR00255 family)
MLSMTGYGTGYRRSGDTSVTVEVRSVNHRFLDLHVRLPREYLFMEADLQQVVRSTVRRGRVDVSITIQAPQIPGYTLNLPLARAYVESVGNLSREFGMRDPLDLRTLLGLPGVVQVLDSESGPAAASHELLPEVVDCVREALRGVERMRIQEGIALRKEMLQHLESAMNRADRVRAASSSVVEEYRKRLESRLNALLAQGAVDQQRLAQEVAIMAEKSDISEEAARLGSHIDQFRNLLDGVEVGKQMDFLLQEMQREANTILSKSAGLEVARIGIELKADIERLREQVQNVE